MKQAAGPTYPVVPSLLILLLLTLATQPGSLAYATERDFATVVLPSPIVLLLVTVPLAAFRLSVVLFGLVHVPRLAAAGAATAVGTVATLTGNAPVGALCGWCYWRRGLVAAMSAHFLVYIALHVFPALVG